MNNNFEDNLFSLLKKEPSFINEDGDILKDKVIDSAYKANPKLIGILLENKDIKNKFFGEIEGYWVFNINDFVTYIQDKNFLNDSYTKYKNKIGLNVGERFLNERKEVSLVWPFKDCILEGGMTKEDQKKKEIFFNEILAQDEIDKLFNPKVLTNWKRYTLKGQEEVKNIKRDENGIIKENLIIKGNNLLALHTLRGQFQGKVKLIYIDPPYNTESNRFGYNDSFTNSTWLTFMKNRLEISKSLLKEDGLIIIQIDEDQGHYLKVLADSVFGKENFRNEIIWSYRTGGVSKKTTLPKKHDTLLCYAKSDKFLFLNIYERQYLEKSFMGSKKDDQGRYYVDTLLRDVIEGIIISPQNNKLIEYNVRPVLNLSSERIENFQSQKPEGLIRLLLDITTKQGDLIMDYHLGSGTTASVAHKTGRQYIGIEQLDYGENDSVIRLNGVIKSDQTGISKSINWNGGGDFIYCELMKYNESFVEKIKESKDTKSLLKTWDDIKNKAYFKHNFEMQEFEKDIEKFKKIELKQQKKILFNILDKNQLYVNYSEIDDKKFKVGEKDKKINREFYER